MSEGTLRACLTDVAARVGVRLLRPPRLTCVSRPSPLR